jgi:thiamine-phosphate pyrophosphorylase
VSTSVLLSRIAQAISWGVDFIQLREKDLSDQELFQLTCASVRLARGTDCKILVNGRIDIAMAGAAHGVHLPSTGLLPSDLAGLVSKGCIVGVSAHSMREARNAVTSGADYLLLGPVFRTPSKIRYGNPLGLQRFRRICRESAVPVFGLGGIRPHAISAVLAAGASGIAGIRIFQTDLGSFQRNEWLPEVGARS